MNANLDSPRLMEIGNEIVMALLTHAHVKAEEQSRNIQTIALSQNVILFSAIALGMGLIYGVPPHGQGFEAIANGRKSPLIYDERLADDYAYVIDTEGKIVVILKFVVAVSPHVWLWEERPNLEMTEAFLRKQLSA